VRCVACHDQNQKKKPPSLHGDRFGKYGWSEAGLSLNKLGWGMSGGNGTALSQKQYSIPGQIGARASRLYQMLAPYQSGTGLVKGHHDVKLAPQEMRRITLWLDCNSNFYGAYQETEKQAKGAVVRPKLGAPAWVKLEKLTR
jgi:hypothetical protein